MQEACRVYHPGDVQEQASQQQPTGVLRRSFLQSPVTALSLQPGGPDGIGNLLLAVGNKINIYQGLDASQGKTCLRLRGPQEVARISFVLADPDGCSIWTGHADGSVMLVTPRAPPLLQYRHNGIHAPVCSMAVDGCGRCWVGHNSGALQVLTSPSSPMGAALEMMDLQAHASKGPLYAVACKQQLVFSTAGRHGICVWDCSSRRELARGDCSVLGAATCLLAMDTDEHENRLQAIDEAGDPLELAGVVSCRLLSGHWHSQIVIWQVLADGQLVKQAVVNNMRLASPILTLMAFPQLSALMSADSSSALNIMRLPSDLDLQEAAGRMQETTGHSSTAQQPTLDLGCKEWKSHWKGIKQAASLGDVVVTASTTTVRVWSAAKLVQDAISSKGFQPAASIMDKTLLSQKVQVEGGPLQRNLDTLSIQSWAITSDPWGTPYSATCSTSSSSSGSSNWPSFLWRRSIDSDRGTSLPLAKPSWIKPTLCEVTREDSQGDEVGCVPSQPWAPAAVPEAVLAAELAAHCSYQFVKQAAFGASRALQVRSNHTNRLHTLLQIPRVQLQRLDHSQRQELARGLQQASELHHPHTLQVQEVFLGPLHLNIVLEECSAGRLVDFPAQQHSMWAAGGDGGVVGSSGAALSPEFARWFFQQVVLAVDYCHTKGVTGLAIEDTLLKVAPNIPQPVVKLPAAVLAYGLPGLLGLTGRHMGQSSGLAQAAGKKQRDPVKEDLYSCGVLLLRLLGVDLRQEQGDGWQQQLQQRLQGQQQQQQQQQQTSQKQPEQHQAKEQQAALIQLLQGLLHSDSAQPFTVADVMANTWFCQHLPPTASSMTQRFVAKGRTCRQPAEEIAAIVQAARLTVTEQVKEVYQAQKQCVTRHTIQPMLQRQQPQHYSPSRRSEEEAVVAGPRMLQQLHLQVYHLQQGYLLLVAAAHGVPAVSSMVEALGGLVHHTCQRVWAALSAAPSHAAQQQHNSQEQSAAGREQQCFIDTGYTARMLLVVQQCCSEALMLMGGMATALHAIRQAQHLSLLPAAQSDAEVETQQRRARFVQQMHLHGKVLQAAACVLAPLTQAAAAANAVSNAVWLGVSGLHTQLPPLKQSVEELQKPTRRLKQPGKQLQQGVRSSAQSAKQLQQRVQFLVAQHTVLGAVVLPLVLSACTGLQPKAMYLVMQLVLLIIDQQYLRQQQRQQQNLAVAAMVVYQSSQDLQSSLQLQQRQQQPVTNFGGQIVLDGCLSGQQQEVQVVGVGALWAPSKQYPAADSAAEAGAGRQVPAAGHPDLALMSAAHTPEASSQLAHTLQQLLAADGSSHALAPIHGMCLDPPLLVLPKPPCGTLEQWIRTAGSRFAGGVGDFTAAWVSGMSWTQVLQLLGDVAAALGLLHQQQPAVVHGGVHAAAINLLQQLSHQQQQQSVSGSGCVCQLSLAGLLSQLAPISSCHPFLAAPEVALAAGPATPAADVYGFGVLMFQLASGWLPQQYTPGTNEQISAVMWCREMMATAGTTSPLAAAACLQQQQSSGSVCEPAGPWTPYGRHMLSPDAQARLPAGYYGLMEACLQRSATARPNMFLVAARLQEIHLDRMAQHASGPVLSNLTSM